MRVWEKRCKRVCAAVLLTAVILRAAGSGSLAAAGQQGADLLADRGFAAFLLYLQTGRRISWAPTPEPTEPSPTETLSAPAPTSPEAVGTSPPAVPSAARVFTPEEAADIQVKYGGSYRPDIGALLAQPVDLDFSGDEPRVLLISTHATEAYTMESGWEYTPTAEARTTDTGYNVVRVAAELAAVLREGGIAVIHDTTLNDYPSYNGAYSQASSRIQSLLEEYPTIQMVIDVHRDAVADENGNQISMATVVDGKDTAQVMLVMGTDEGGLNHPNWEGNLSWALKIQKIMDEEYPGLARPLNLRTERFNEQLTPGSCLVEVGTAGDTLAEALTAVRMFGYALVEAIKGL